MKKRFLFVMATILILSMSMVTMISGCGCQSTVTNSTADEASTTATSIETVTEIATDEQGNTYVEEATKIVEAKTDNKSDEKSENEKSENEKSENEKSESSKADDTDDRKDSSSSKSSSSSSSKSGNNSSSSKNSNSSSNKSSSSSSSTSNNQKSSNTEETKHTHSWVDITKQVKVVDQEAYTYEEPVYETQGRTICNVCGDDITENRVEHSKNHALTDGSGGYHDEWVQVQVGTKTVEVPEKSHYITKTIGHKCSSCNKTEYY